MSSLVVTVRGDGIKRLEQAARVLGEGKARRAYSMAINDTGAKAASAAGRAMPGQTGLPAATARRALKKRTRSSPATLTFTVHTQGGDISLKYFAPRETRKGVSAKPWNSRRVYPSTFMKGGLFPNRKTVAKFNGHVFKREGGGKWPIALRDSGLFIPEEVVKGAIAEGWQSKAADLQPRAEHIIRHMSKGAIT